VSLPLPASLAKKTQTFPDGEKEDDFGEDGSGNKRPLISFANTIYER
jgi:hypothetical protein